MSSTKWRPYEEVARYLLNQLASHFGIGHVEGKQVVSGQSGANWELDAKAVLVEGTGFLVVECRRHTMSRLKQSHLAALAFTITDTGAAGGIVVTPLELQAGAKQIAKSSNVKHVIMDPESSTTDYWVRYLNRAFVGLSDAISLGDSFEAVVTRADGSTERK